MNFGDRTDSQQAPAGAPQGADPAARTDRIPVGDQGTGEQQPGPLGAADK